MGPIIIRLLQNLDEFFARFGIVKKMQKWKFNFFLGWVNQNILLSALLTAGS